MTTNRCKQWHHCRTRECMAPKGWNRQCDLANGAERSSATRPRPHDAPEHCRVCGGPNARFGRSFAVELDHWRVPCLGREGGRGRLDGADIQCRTALRARLACTRHWRCSAGADAACGECDVPCPSAPWWDCCRCSDTGSPAAARWRDSSDQLVANPGSAAAIACASV